ncbi:hypothetical protein MLD52_15480 [Puniceicoccaceae bacterium K14]|nr:hypothetical protein [Puniceicoccaceae bacterium K14]
MEPKNRIEEQTLVSRCLSGETEAQESFHQVYNQSLIDFLINSGAEKSDARELIANFLTECVYHNGSREPRLLKWSPQAPLLAWLRRSAKNYFRDFVRKQSRQQPLDEQLPTNDPTNSLVATSPPSLGDDSEILADALRHARQSVPAEDYVLATLVCHGIKQGHVATILGYSNAKVSRKIAACLQKLKTETLAYIKTVDPHFHFTWEDLSKIATNFLNERTEIEANSENQESYNLDLEENPTKNR